MSYKQDKQHSFKKTSQEMGSEYKRISNEPFKLLRCYTLKDVIKGELFCGYL